MAEIPLQNLTALNSELILGWMPSSNTRGTADILYSCIITISLCVYTALHLNIPAPGESRVSLVMRQGKWLVIGIFAPEVVLYSAWIQYRTAKELIKDLNHEHREHMDGHCSAPLRPTALYGSMLQEVYKVPYAQGAEETKKAFDMTYGFYAVMGGFRADIHDLDEDVQSAALLPRTIRILARNGVFLRIDETTINDKSKADVLAKSLVLVQVSWMVLQCLGRKAAGYPLTILEIHTFIHVICASVMYAFWFKKPLNVGEATLLNLEDKGKNLIAYILVNSWAKQFHVKFQRPRPPRDFMYLSFSTWSIKFDKSAWHADPGATTTVAVTPVPWAEVHAHENSLLRGNLTYAGSNLLTFEPDGHLWHHRLIGRPYHLSLRLTEQEQRRWRMAHEAAMTLREEVKFEFLQLYLVKGRVWNLFGEDVKGTYFSGAVDLAVKDVKSNRALLYLAVFVLTAYACLHMSAWNADFPTYVERWLWRGSCITLATALPYVIAYEAFDTLAGKHWFEREFNAFFQVPLMVIGLVLAFVFIYGLIAMEIAYPVARLYLIVESFVSLRNVPIGVYATVPWASYVPHF